MERSTSRYTRHEGDHQIVIIIIGIVIRVIITMKEKEKEKENIESMAIEPLVTRSL